MVFVACHVGHSDMALLARRSGPLVRRVRPVAPDCAARDLWVRTRDGQRRIAIDRIDYVMAERDYMRIFIGGQSHMIADSMAAMQKRMQPMGFLRIHRSVLVRQAAIAGLVRRRYGMLAVRLEDGTELAVGRSHVAGLMQALGLRPERDG